MKALAAFIAEHGITADIEAAANNPNIDRDEWSRDGSHHHLVTLHRNGDSLAVPFSCGSACDPPDAATVLDCLASDASSVENADSFEEWAANLGYDTDSRKAEHTYRAVLEQRDGLAAMLGGDAYNELLWETERL